MSETHSMFFQLVVEDTELGEVRVERWGVVNVARSPTREEVIAEVGMENARGEFVEWTQEVVVNGVPRVNYYAAFERVLEREAERVRQLVMEV